MTHNEPTLNQNQLFKSKIVENTPRITHRQLHEEATNQFTDNQLEQEVIDMYEDKTRLKLGKKKIKEAKAKVKAEKKARKEKNSKSPPTGKGAEL